MNIGDTDSFFEENLFNQNQKNDLSEIEKVIIKLFDL